MRVYPKGCRYTRIVDGTVDSSVKVTRRCDIEELFRMRATGGEMAIVVQPRGKNRWWLFKAHHMETPRYIQSHQERDMLVMRAVLGW